MNLTPLRLPCVILTFVLSNSLAFAQRVTFDSPDVVTVDQKTGKIALGPNPTNIGQLFNLLRTKEVRDALGFSDEQKNAIDTALKSEKEQIQQLLAQKVPMNEIVGSLRSKSITVYDELLTPEQKLRMRQIVFRIEVSVIGLASALTEGRLGEQVHIHENQMAHIQQKGKEIEARAKAEILAILKRAEVELLSELAPEQRVAAEESLGDFFLYSNNVKSMQELREQLIANQRAQNSEKGSDKKNRVND